MLDIADSTVPTKIRKEHFEVTRRSDPGSRGTMALSAECFRMASANSEDQSVPKKRPERGLKGARECHAARRS